MREYPVEYEGKVRCYGKKCEFSCAATTSISTNMLSFLMYIYSFMFLKALISLVSFFPKSCCMVLTDRLSPDQSDSPPPNWNKKTINYKMTGCIDNGHFKGPKNADDVP